VSASGAYWLKFTDDECMLPADTVNITFSSLNASFTVTNVNCYGESNGSIITTPTGGVSPYTYQWTGNGINTATQNISNLPAGTYYLALSDNTGCTKNYTVSVSQPDELEVWVVLLPVTKPNPLLLRAEVSGGTPPYSFKWSYIPLEGPRCTPLPPEYIYTKDMLASYNQPPLCEIKVVVTDAHGCQITASYSSKSEPDNKGGYFTSSEKHKSSDNEITLIPNPTSGTFTILNIDDATIYLYSSLGAYLKTFEHVSNNETMNISELPSGIYFLRIVEKNSVKNEKIILSK
jgi:hypothetical protein